MAIERENNNSLYFIVGALVVLVGILTFVFLSVNDTVPGADITSVAPAAGNDTAGDETRVDLNFDNDGASGSITDTDRPGY